MTLNEGLRNLSFANRAFNDGTARQDRNFSQVNLHALSTAIEQIDSVAKPVTPGDAHLQEWEAYTAGRVENLTSRVIRRLSWHPEVALNERFWDLINRSERIRASAKVIQGLVYSCHSKWDKAKSLPQFSGIRDTVTSFSGPNGVVKKWQERIHLLLHENSVASLAQEFYRRKMPLEHSVSEIRLFEDTQFIREVVSESARLCINRLEDAETLDYFVYQILSWEKHYNEIFKEHVNSSVLSTAFDRSDDVKARLVNYVVNDVQRLGDPRLQPTRWIGIEQSKDKVLQHLSKEDIIFFFKKVMANDVHGRAKFWLEYVPSMVRSRPLLTEMDRVRLRSALNESGNTTRHFGRTTNQYSAFLLDFGNVMAIEFDTLGACYLYDARTRDRYFRDFFTDAPFTTDQLKMPRQVLYKKNHQGSWQWPLRQALAQSGVRPR